MDKKIDSAEQETFWESEAYLEFYLQNVLTPAISQKSKLLTKIQLLFFGRKFIPLLYALQFFRGRIRLHQYDFEKGLVLAIRRLGKKRIGVTDVGGGGGDNYFNLRLFAKKKFQFDWTLVDNSTLTIRSEILRKSHIRVGDRILLQIEDSSDILILNGTLQFLKSNTSACNFQELHRFILINRTVFSDENKTVRQKIVFEGIQKGTHLVSNRVLNEESLCSELADLGYSVCWRGGARKYHLQTERGMQEGYYKTILFELITK
jgi:putative methyltransferase (TIGR04325 family)